MTAPLDEVLVGIDVGTTVTKAVVVALDGTELAWGRAATPWRAASSGNEAYPEDILSAAGEATAIALEAVPAARVLGLGATSMAETVVRLAPDGRPVGTCIAWHDKRGGTEAEELEKAFGAQGFSELTGLRISSLCTLVKLAWLSRHHSAFAPRALSVADWVVHSLGGEQLSEASLASRTGALRLEGRRWWEEGLEWAGVPVGLFPPVAQAGERAGSVTAQALEAVPSAGGHRPTLGRLLGAAVTSAGHDHMCAAAGAGAVLPGQILDSSGTAEAFVRSVPPLDGPGLARAVAAGLNSGWHTIPGRYTLVKGHTLGLFFDSVLRLLGVEGLDQVARLDREAHNASPSSVRVVREGAYANPSVLDLDANATPAAVWNATLDAVTADALQYIRTIESIGGPAQELVLSGGWARCDGFRQRRQGLLPSVRWPAVTEAGARGAALFGGCAAGLFEGPLGFPTPEDRPLSAAQS